MTFELIPMEATDIAAFKSQIQEAFQMGFEAVYGPTSETILPEADIDHSLNAAGSVAYKALTKPHSITIWIYCIPNPASNPKVLACAFGRKSKSCIPKRKYGKPARLTLRNGIFIFM